jgi:hypothetical protein
MGPMGVVEPLELPQGVVEVALIPDQGAVQQFTRSSPSATGRTWTWAGS